MKIAIVRIRGSSKMTREVIDTFKMLNLNTPNNCVVVELTPEKQGMLKKIAPYVTWGPVDEKTLAELKKRDGKVFRLNPPRKGYGKKGVKMPFSRGGATGGRKEKINDLIQRML